MSNVAAAKPAEKKPPLGFHDEIDPHHVKRQYEGFRWDIVEVYLPPSASLVDLNERPDELWRRVQMNSATALKHGDEVRIWAADQSWLVRAIVAGATERGVVLADIKRIEMPARQALYSDGTYAVRFYFGGFAVFRLSDGMKMTDTFAIAAHAERALKGLYPRPL